MRKLITMVFVVLLPLISEAQWSPAFNISPNAVSAGLNESMGSCIGVNDDTVHVVFCNRFNSTHGAIYYTRSGDSGLTWTTPIAITDTNDNAWNPAISVTGSAIHVVWRVIDTTNNHRSSHYVNSLDGGNTWGVALTIDSVVADWPAITSSGNSVFVVNDIVTSAAPYNTEIFFLKSTDNGFTWSTHQQITFAIGRSEDEAITAEGCDLFMSWNDNRSGQMEIYYKHSGNCGVTWDSDVVVILPHGYGTMVSADSANIDVVAAGAPSGHYQVQLAQSSDTGSTWGSNVDLTADTANTYYYPDMVRDGNDLHITYVKSGIGAQYIHSIDGGVTWSPPYTFCFSGITPFIAYTGCVLHVIVPDSGHINYFRNPTGNSGTHCINTTGITSFDNVTRLNIFPDPAMEDAMIEIDAPFKIAELIVYNTSGEVVLRKKIKSSSAKIRRELLNNGIYFCLVRSESGQTLRGKFIVQ